MAVWMTLDEAVELTAEAACVDRRGPCVVCHTAAPPR